KHSNRGEDRAGNLSAVNLRPAERAEQADYQQRSPNSKKQKIRPWKIPRRWKPHEEPVREQPGDDGNKADPDRPVPSSFHFALAGAKWRIQRYSPIAIAAKPSPPRNLPAISKPGPTSASGA